MSWLKEKEPATEKHVGKRRKRRECVRVVNQASRLQVCYLHTEEIWKLLLFFFFLFPTIYNNDYFFEQRIFTAVKWLLLFVTLLVAVAAGLYYGYKGLLKLSDWMNEVEEQRQRKRFPRI